MYRWSSRSHFLSQSRSRASLKLRRLTHTHTHTHTHTLLRLEPAAHQTTDRQTDGGIMMAWRGASAVVILLSITPVSASPVYDPNYCYILDSILLLYAVIITAFFVRERYNTKRGKGDQDSVYQPISKTQSPYDVLRGAEEGPARGGRRRGDDTYTPLQKKSDDTYREIEAKPGQRRRTDQVYQGLSSATKDTYDALHMQQIHPPPR
uniref:T-cell surface glycoprotein CD3 zeta chain n=1 Tax=Cyprinus carpio TaxID=7962 RepID=A0A8C1PRH5_CYPCA